ncbi:MAG: 5-formyltetrahydrofolate cyclo-ligase [Candidatus Sumerlaeota bacterium]
MSDALALQKTSLRTAVRAQLAALSDSAQKTASDLLGTQLHALSVLSDGKHLLAFYPHKNEISSLAFLREWLSAGRSLLFPRVDADERTLTMHQITDIAELKPGYRGILEPSNSCNVTNIDSIDAMFIPGLAFDARGNRLGQGGGHYDRLLARLPRSCATIGLAYDWQVVDSVPVVEHDQCLQWIVTPTRTIDCSK